MSKNTNHQTGLSKEFLEGWAKKYPHHKGVYHYFDRGLLSVCGNREVRIEEYKQMKILDTPRPTKKCKACLRVLGLPIPEIPRVA